DFEMNDPIDADTTTVMKKNATENVKPPEPKKRKMDSTDEMSSSSKKAQCDDENPSTHQAPKSMQTVKRKRPQAVQSSPIVCTACDAQFTKKQSLYRHNKICT
ncbi:hypothetical protein PENTCL1PPCAC_12815, partial [Pristionchus entomophagus]